MSLQLNTSHPLYANLISLVAVDAGDVITDLVDPLRTVTPTDITFADTALGRAFVTATTSWTVNGLVSLPDAPSVNTYNDGMTTLVVVASITGSGGNHVFFRPSGLAPSLRMSGEVAGYTSNTALIAPAGVTDVRNSGAHTICAARNPGDGVEGYVYVDGVLDATIVSVGFANAGSKITDIGGFSGQGGVSAQFVWYASFNKTLSQAEIADLHASLGADQQFGLVTSAAPDTTAPTLTTPTATATGETTASGSVSTDEASGTLYYLASTNASETATTVKSASSQAVSATGVQSVTFSGLTASTTYYAHYVHRDAAGNDSAVATSASFTTSAAGDTTAPTLTGSITISALTTTSYTATWPAGSDDTAVTGYEYRIAGGSWVDAGDVLTVDITGRTPGATETFEVRAYDAAGNRSTPALSTSVTLNSATATVTVTEPLKNNTGTLLASQSGITVAVLQAADLVSVHEATGLTTDASGLLAAISDAAITTGQQYHVAIKLADGSVGITGPITAS